MFNREKPYSIAIMIKGCFPDSPVQIFATDIDDAVLDKSKQGIYQEQALKELPPALLNKFLARINMV